MQDLFSLEGKTILVTGASSGIGKAIAVRLAAQGAALVITGRNEARLHQTVDSLQPGNHLAMTADLTRPEDVDRLATTAGSLDGVVFCAGAIEYMSARQMDPMKMQGVLDINFNAQIALYQALHRNKKLHKGASLVFIASVSAYAAVPATLAYAASKAAILSAVRVLASELSKFRIRVNGISPGLIRTSLLETAALDEEILAQNEAKYPLGMGEAEDVANAAVFLLSDASKKITGIDLVVDGGYLLHQ